MTEEKKKTKTERWKYCLFAFIVLVLIFILKGIDGNLKTNDEKIAEYKAELQQLQDERENQEYENALKRANYYYDQGYSKQKIKDILVGDIEKFPEEVAQYAIDNL